MQVTIPPEFFSHFHPIQFVWGVVAMFGGIARYLNGYMKGEGFKFSFFLSSAFVAGFSGWCFAQIGVSLGYEFSTISMMAGVGGFFGDSTLKFIYEYITRKLK